jgi:hypothetical protein
LKDAAKEDVYHKGNGNEQVEDESEGGYSRQMWFFHGLVFLFFMSASNLIDDFGRDCSNRDRSEAYGESTSIEA